MFSISRCPSTCCFHPPSVYILIPGLWSWSRLHIPVFQTPVLIRYIVTDTVGTQLDLWGLPLCQVCSWLLFPCICIELRITTVSVCHLCSACPCLRVSSYTSGLISVSPSQRRPVYDCHGFICCPNLCHASMHERECIQYLHSLICKGVMVTHHKKRQSSQSGLLVRNLLNT